MANAPAVKKAAPAKKVAAAAPKTESTPVVKQPAGPVYVARKALTIGDKKFKPGDVVPEANGWTRVETWVRAGYLDVQGA